MAKATATCTCKYCEKEFTKTATKYNRRDADEWEEWAADYYDECPQCWSKRKREEENSKPATAHIGLNPYSKLLTVAVSGNTMPIKDILKGIGCRWDYRPESGFWGMLSMRTPQRCWQIKVRIHDISTLEQEIIDLSKKFIDIGVDVKSEITTVDYYALREMLAMEKQKEEAIAKQIAEIEKPEMPDCYPSGKWNGRYYGSDRNGWSIYSDGEKITITKEEKSRLEEYQLLMAEYNKAVANIKTNM